MTDPFIFDSRSIQCKEPFGAAPCGQRVTFRCRPLAREAFTHCALVLFHEFSHRTQEVELSNLGPEGERVCFGGTVSAPEEPELTWYHFRFWRDDGTGCVLDKTGYRSDSDLRPWQLTTYRPSHTPAWFGSGVTYQIFPDRFCRLNVPDPRGLVGNRWVHRAWSDQPAWKPDPDGEIRNRDFFGGSLAGITSKLDLLAGMGVTTLYLCPIFESASNHRYNTADYTRIDPMLGTEKDFATLCSKAWEKGIRVELEVFDHDIDKKSLLGPAPLAARFAADMRTTHSNFGLMVDLSHIPMTRETPQFVIRTLRPYITHLHMGNTVVDDPAHTAYGDLHPRFGFPNGENDTAELLDFLRVLKQEGLFNKEDPMVLSFEVKPWDKEDVDVVLANAKRVLNRAWALLED